MDSALIFADIALSYDDQLAEAYDVKGSIYEAIGRSEQAIEEFENIKAKIIEQSADQEIVVK